jgi:hypothetical protein
MPAQAPAEEAEANDNRPEADHLPDAGKKPAIVTAASRIKLEKQKNIMAQDEDDPRARCVKAEREHAEAKRALARAKLEEARAEWELVHIKTQAVLERAKRRRDC